MSDEIIDTLSVLMLAVFICLLLDSYTDNK